MNNEKMSFSAWLEAEIGVTWAYFDNNYGAKQADEIYLMYLDYLNEED